jgi:ketosteroid isomerase-like protein
MDDASILRQLADRQAIRDLIYTYCRAVDRLDIPLGHSIWHEDGYADYGADYYQGPGRAVIDKICQQQLSLLSHSHQVTNILIRLDGDQAGSEAYISGSMRLEKDGKLMQLGVWGRYIDAWERRAGNWGLARRVVVFDHEEIRDVRTTGRVSRATRDRNDPSYRVMSGPKD